MNELFEDFAEKFEIGFMIMIILVIIIAFIGFMIWKAPLVLIGICAFLVLSLLVGHLVFYLEYKANDEKGKKS